MENKKEILVSAIENGTVIDHIPTESVYQVIRILGLEKYKDEVLIGNYLNSSKLGKKGIVKIKNKHFSVEEVSKIALVAPLATIIDIYNDRQAYKRGTAENNTCFNITPSAKNSNLKVKNASWNDGDK